MLSKPLLALCAGATLVVGNTPSGYTPNSNTDLIVAYGQTAAMNGVVVEQAATASAPTIATKSRLDGTSYAVIMVDLDTPSGQSPRTFLHWMQTGLTPVITASTISASNGSTQAFTLSNAKNTSAIVAYTPPAPPAQNPLSHRYAQVLVDTSSMTSAGLSALQSAAETRVGFDTDSVLQDAGLSSNVVAGNSFNVTNPGQTFSSASFGNSTSIGIGNGQQADQMIKSDGGFKGFGAAGAGVGGTLTTTISSAPAGPTSGLTNAGKSGSATSTASGAFGRDYGHLFTLMATSGFVTSVLVSRF
ncbi:hypothetical protein INS49_014334 [Diaporthe citri]|uniref:uncharacterized protein n=1 Tax=Diaporthe citri TaxID=83186 RepID=UPI001C81F88E|nr:uncharacterized protein INS49_014334 [Diaporthe citri]KAG6358450.1 hypothetical protein INS49_014334 [Diaporthe citri]